MEFKKYISEIAEDIRDYVKLQIEHAKYEVIEEGSRTIAGIFSFIFILVFFCISLLLLGICLGFFLTEVFKSSIAGFGIASAIFFFILLMMFIFRKQLLERPFMNTAIKHIFRNIREKQHKK